MGGTGIMRRAGFLGLGIAVLVTALAPGHVAATSAPPPKVAIIVGPAGATVTARYRAEAEAAAVIAQTLTPNVVRVYSPDATWPAVRAAVSGASVVIYLGHGNGWPSPYSDALMPRSQDGFGLNPVGGGDEVAHQYYGEAAVGKVHLAPGAVVLLDHLCYASGNSEPQLPPGTFADALARVDNFAAGFLAAGATTVVAEGHANPDALIAAAIGGNAAFVHAWTSAPWGHGNIASYQSARTPGAVISLDPDTATTGYYRSMVQAAGSAAPVLPGSGTPAVPTGSVAGPPSLVAAGIRFGTAAVAGAVLPGAAISVRLPVAKAASTLPAALVVGLRWLPLTPASPDPAGTIATGDLVVGDAASDIVGTADATVSGKSVVVPATAPTDPGTYVVLLTLETADGTPYDVATQALLRPFTVGVPRAIDVVIAAPASIDAAAQGMVHVPITLLNSGTVRWGSDLAPLWDDPTIAPWLARYLDSVLVLNATWLDPATGSATPAASYPLPRSLAIPGGATTLDVAMATPPLPGNDLLVLTVTSRGALGAFPERTLVIPAAIR